MTVLKIIGIVLAAVLLLLLLLLVLPISVSVCYDPEKALRINVKVLFFTVYKTKAGVETQQAEGEKKQKAPPKKEKLLQDVRDMVALVKNLLGPLGGLLKTVQISKLQLRAVCAGEDPADVAMEYGLVCAAVYPFIGYLQTVSNVRRRGVDVGISCDFEQEKPTLSFSATVSAMVLHGGIALLRFIIKQAEE